MTLPQGTQWPLMGKRRTRMAYFITAVLRLLVTFEATQELKDWAKGENAKNLFTVQKCRVLKLKAIHK